MARKWLILCAALALGEGLAFALPSGAAACRYTVLIAALLLSTAFCGWRMRGGLVLICGLLGFARTGQYLADQQQIFQYAKIWNKGAPLEAEFDIPEYVASWTTRKGTTNILFKADIGAASVNVRISRWEGGELPRPGERWRCAGWLNTEKPERGGRFAYRVVGRGTFAERVNAVDPYALSTILRKVRGDFSRRLGIGVSADAESLKLVRAIILGERAQLPRATQSAFADAGTIHVFAISGLHVMIVAKILSVALLIFFVPARFLGFVLVPLVWLYVILTGASPSAIRAATMASIYFAAPIFYRAPNGLIAWAATFLAVHLWNPALLQNIGCRLSFAVVLVLILSVRASRFYGKKTKLLVLTLATWAAGVPLVASAFGRFTLRGLVANLVLVPAAEFAVIAGSVGLLASYISSVLAAYFNNLAVLFADAMAGISFLTAAFPGAHGETPPWSWSLCLAWYFVLGALLALLAHFGERHRLDASF